MSAYSPQTITVILQPKNETMVIPRPKTVLRLMDTLGIGLAAALFIRDGQLLTHDRRIEPDDVITVRSVVSCG